MHSGTGVSNGDRVKVLGGLLRSWGYNADDFEVEEDHDCELAHLFGLTDSIVIVRRRSTGEERIYASGIGSAWFGTLLMDLARGHFASSTTRKSRAMLLQ